MALTNKAPKTGKTVDPNKVTYTRKDYSEPVVVQIPGTFDVKVQLCTFTADSGEKAGVEGKLKIDVAISEDGEKFTPIRPDARINPTVALAMGDPKVQALLKSLKFGDDGFALPPVKATPAVKSKGKK